MEFEKTVKSSRNSTISTTKLRGEQWNCETRIYNKLTTKQSLKLKIRSIRILTAPECARSFSTQTLTRSHVCLRDRYLNIETTYSLGWGRRNKGKTEIYEGIPPLGHTPKYGVNFLYFLTRSENCGVAKQNETLKSWCIFTSVAFRLFLCGW